jgi:hypothetical protein
MSYKPKVKTGSGEKSNVWECSEGCDVQTTICVHLEKSLPQMRDGKMQVATPSRTDETTFDVLTSPRWDETEFRALIRSYGFVEQWDVELLVDRYVYGRSLRAIEKEHGYIGWKTVHRRLKKLHDELVERGFKPRSKK